jgi:hypothetical protein
LLLVILTVVVVTGLLEKPHRRVGLALGLRFLITPLLLGTSG